MKTCPTANSIRLGVYPRFGRCFVPDGMSGRSTEQQ